jgi:hypothetical protein
MANLCIERIEVKALWALVAMLLCGMHACAIC